jgi:hypothetical protein
MGKFMLTSATPKRCIIVLLALLFFTSCKGQDKDNTPTIGEYTQAELDEMGVNPCHVFIFNDCSMSYNGKPFYLGQTIDEIVEIFGPYSRDVEKGADIFHGHIYMG